MKYPASVFPLNDTLAKEIYSKTRNLLICKAKGGKVNRAGEGTPKNNIGPTFHPSQTFLAFKQGWRNSPQPA